MGSFLDHYVGKNILVTGGAGSIGSGVVSKLLSVAKRVFILSRDESLQSVALYQYSGTLGKIADIRNRQAVYDILREGNIDIVIHAAAMKHVDLCQKNVYEAIDINLNGSKNILDACSWYGAELIAISTDKAVYPEGVMGLTKRLQELMYINGNYDNVKIVRFGNVLGSRGSVVWKFKEQFEQNKPITITNPLMRRYVLTPSQAADLVLYAGAKAPGKSITIKEMPWTTISNLALAVTNGEKTAIDYIGNRGGEKLDEQLLSDDEISQIQFAHTDIGRIIFIRDDAERTLLLAAKQEFVSDMFSKEITWQETRALLRDAGVVND